MDRKSQPDDALAPMNLPDDGGADYTGRVQTGLKLYSDAQGATAGEQVLAVAPSPSDKSVENTSESRRNDWAQRHDVRVAVGGDGALNYSISVNGSEQTLFSTQDSAEGLALAEKKLEGLTAQYENELRGRYKVRFSKEGEEVQGQVSYDSTGKVQLGEMVYARAPHLGELANLRGALERGRPSQLLPSNNHQGLKFYFLKSPLRKDADDAAATHVAHDKDGKAAIYVGPDGLGEGIVVKDGKQSFAGRFDEHIVLHEISHNTQARLGWLKEKQFMTYSRAIGFEPFVSPEGETIFAMRDKKGGLHRVDPDSLDWLTINDRGQYLDKSGKVTDINRAERLDPGKMRDAALVRPATSYYSNPLEMAAEALALFKGGRGERRNLLQDCPELYRFTKEQDQKDINQSYGKSPEGKPLYVRLPDGRLSLSNIEAEKLIVDFEKTAMMQVSK